MVLGEVVLVLVSKPVILASVIVIVSVVLSLNVAVTTRPERSSVSPTL